MTPAPRTASRTSSSLNGLMIAVTRWGISFSCSEGMGQSRAGCTARQGWRVLDGAALTGGCVGDVGCARRQVRRGGVGHALPEFDVIGGSSMLVEVETLELAVLGDAQRPAAPEGLDRVHH